MLRWKSVGDALTVTGKAKSGVNQLGQELDDQDPPREKNGLPPMVNIMKIASAKSQSTRGAYHQPTFMGNSLTISETCLLFLRSR